MHLKYRPTTYDELVGLGSIKKSLSAFQFDVPVMFMGERGCGKTTLAGILALEFGANEQTIQTINCGYYTKIDDMRKEIDRLHKTSLYGTKRVLILDEIHSLSKASYKAWLTPLENLPKDIMVVGCTTEPQMIPEMLLERFVSYKVGPLTQKQSRLLIEQVLEKEGLDIPKWVKIKVIEQSQGIPRRILTALPKVVNIKDESDVDTLLEILSIDQEAEALDVLKCLISKTGWGGIKKSLATALKDATPEKIRLSLMNLIGGRLMSNFANNDAELFRLSKFYRALQLAEGYPEKANLIIAVYKAYYDFKK